MYSIVDLVGSGGQSNFTFAFPYLDRTHIHMYIDGEETEDFSFMSTFIVTLDTPLVGAATVRVRRLTPIDEAAVDYSNGSNLGESDLDATALQSLYVAQELSDISESTIQANNAFDYDAHDHRIIDVANPVNAQDAVTKAYADAQSGTAAQLAAVQQAQAAASEAALTLVEIEAIDLSNVSEFMRTVLAAETPADARDLLDALTGTGAALENPSITGSVTGVYTLENPTITGTVEGVYTLIEPMVTEPVITDPDITGTITGAPLISPNPTFGSPLAGTLTAGTPLVMNPYAVSSQPSQAHGLGVAPAIVRWYLECLSAEQGYSVGDRISVIADTDSASSVKRGFTVSYDGTSVWASSTATVPQIVNKASNATNGITVAKWKLVVTPYRLN